MTVICFFAFLMAAQSGGGLPGKAPGSASAVPAVEAIVSPVRAIDSPFMLLTESERAEQTLAVTRLFAVCDGLGAGSVVASKPPTRRVGVGAMRAKSKAGPNGGRLTEVEIGPVVLQPSEGPATQTAETLPWWDRRIAEFSVPSPDVPAPEAPPAPCEEAMRPIRSVLPDSAEAVARAVQRHSVAIDALVQLRGLNGQPSRNPKATVPAQPALATDLLEAVTWLELADASQAGLRLDGRVKEADAVVADILALLKAIRCPSMASLLAERVPPGREGFASLSLHPDWRSDAWLLVEPIVRIRANQERASKEFTLLAERIGRESGLAPEAIAELKSRLATVAENLPPGFEWTQRFQDDCEAHMRDAFRANATFGGVPRYPPFEPRNPVVASIYARTVAFEVFGYAWAQPGAMLPSMVEARQAGLDEVLKPFRTALGDGSLVSLAGVDQGRVAIDLIERFLSSEDTRWKPWMVFPAGPEAASEAATSLRSVVLGELRSLNESFVPGLTVGGSVQWEQICWELDGVFGSTGSFHATRNGDRPWIFTDTGVVFWDGNVSLKKQ